MSNELEQYNKYIKEVAHLDTSDFFAKIDCDNKDHGLIRECWDKTTGDAEKDKMRKQFPDVWNRSVTEGERRADCEYALTGAEVHRTGAALTAQLTLEQRRCRSGTAFKGGASFDVKARHEHSMAGCGVRDGFDNTYTLLCQLPPSPATCMNVSAILEHEHYDAFGRESGYFGGSDPHMLVIDVLKDHRLCAGESSTVPAWAAQASPSLYPLGATFHLGSWTKAPHEKNYVWIRGSIDNNSSSSGSNSNSTNIKPPSGDGDEGTHLAASAYEACRSRQTNVLVGDSHQRFNWNWVAYRYHDGQKAYLNTLDGKHGDVSFPRLNLTQLYWYAGVARYLDALQCPTPQSGERLAVALQLGSWALRSLPLRALFTNPREVPAFLAAVGRMQQRGCAATVRLVLSTPTPYPSCDPPQKDTLCHSHQHWKSSHAIAALNQHLYQALLGGPGQSQPPLYGQLAIVDSLDLMQPNKKYFLCLGHFLCRHQERQQYRLETTPPGIAMASEILHAMCHVSSPSASSSSSSSSSASSSAPRSLADASPTALSTPTQAPTAVDTRRPVADRPLVNVSHAVPAAAAGSVALLVSTHAGAAAPLLSYAAALAHRRPTLAAATTAATL